MFTRDVRFNLILIITMSMYRIRNRHLHWRHLVHKACSFDLMHSYLWFTIGIVFSNSVGYSNLTCSVISFIQIVILNIIHKSILLINLILINGYLLAGVSSRFNSYDTTDDAEHGQEFLSKISVFCGEYFRSKQVL